MERVPLMTPAQTGSRPQREQGHRFTCLSMQRHLKPTQANKPRANCTQTCQENSKLIVSMTLQQLPVSYFGANTHRRVTHVAELNISNNSINLSLLFYKSALKAHRTCISNDIVTIHRLFCANTSGHFKLLISVMLDIVQKYTDAG